MSQVLPNLPYTYIRVVDTNSNMIEFNLEVGGGSGDGFDPEFHPGTDMGDLALALKSAFESYFDGLRAGSTVETIGVIALSGSVVFP